MNASDVLLIVGVAMLVFGVFASRMPQPFRARKRWLLIGGGALILLSAIIAWPDFIQGFKDGYSERR